MLILRGPILRNWPKKFVILSGRRAFASKLDEFADRVKIVRSDCNKIVHVKLNRPEKLNALDIRMFEALAEAATYLRKDETVRAIILSGEGKGFCSGLDVKSMLEAKNKFGITMPSLKNIHRLLERRELLGENNENTIGNLAQSVGYLWRSCPVPVIAALHGVVYGGGMQIALGADMRFASHESRLSIMEAKWGLIPDMSGSVTLRELVPIDVAKELTMTGRVISGDEASELNLVTRCVENPIEEALAVARAIICRSPDSVAASKQLFQRNWAANDQKCLELETSMQKDLIGTWNQLSASLRNFGVTLPYKNTKPTHP